MTQMSNAECLMPNANPPPSLGIRSSTSRVATPFGIRHSAFGIFVSAFILLPSSTAFAIGSQEDVLRGISEGVGQEVDGSKVLAVLALMAGLILIIALINQSRQRVVRPKILNHPGKLLKEVSKTVNLKPAEIRQLKTLAEAQELSNPLVLLLCPSVLTRAIKVRPDRVDTKVLGSLTKRLKSQRGTP